MIVELFVKLERLVLLGILILSSLGSLVTVGLNQAKNFKELIKVERRTKKWIQDNDNLLTIIGHTHRPRFQKPGEIAFFNDGSCVHPRSITGIEIEKGCISLIKWNISTTKDGTLKVIRVVLEGPEKIIDYRSVI